MSRGVAGVGRGWQRSVGVGRGPQGSGGVRGHLGRCHRQALDIIGRRQPLRLSTANAACSFNSY